ncbi:MAG: TolC family protein [Brotaphodocola sp.]
MKKNRITAGCLALAVSMSMMTVSAWAVSPEFAYSAEKWETLRDDKLEFEEIADLVHEYNNTVIKNQIAYKDERDKTNDDIAQDYYDAADQIYANIEYPDSDDSSYGSKMSAALNNELSAEQMMERGDESTDDSETLKLGYDKTEASLVKQAQTQMINYWSSYYNLDTLRVRVSQAEQSYQTEENKLAAGMSTQAKILTARESISTAQASLQSAESSLVKIKEDLCLMLGWKYGADVEMGEIPEPDMEKIASIDLESDIQTALENNYDLKLTNKRVKNARTTKVRETQQQTQQNQTEAIAASVRNSYASLVLAQSDYEQAKQAYELELSTFETAQRKLQAGTITPNDFAKQEDSCLTAEVTLKNRKLQFVQAQVNYDWAVNGLASAS